MHQEGAIIASTICAAPRAYASRIVDRQLQVQPEAAIEYGSGWSDLTADTEVRLGYLAEALATDRPALFYEQLSWIKVVCASRGVSPDLLRVNIECMREQLLDLLPANHSEWVDGILGGALTHFDAAPTELPSLLEADAPHIDLARRFLLAMLETRDADATELILDAMDTGIDLRELQKHVLEKVQCEIGRMWQMTEVTIAEEHYCTEIVTATATLVSSRMPRAEPNGKRVIAASVSNELHNFGIRLIGQEYERNGWKVLFLGANTPSVALIDGVRDFGADLILLSVSMALHVRRTAEIIASIRTHPEYGSIPILVGGHPFKLVDDLWEVVGADGCADDSTKAIEIGNRLVGA